MFNKGIDINENAFSWRLQKWIFGKHVKRYDNYCPYFWLTIFCMLIAAPVGLFRLIAFPLVKLADFIENYLTKRTAVNIKQWVDSATNIELYSLYMYIRNHHIEFFGRSYFDKNYSFFRNCWIEWKSRLAEGVDFIEEIRKFEAEWDEDQSRLYLIYEAERDRRAKNKARINKLFNTVVKWTQPVAKGLLLALCGVGGWLLGKLFMFIVANITLQAAILVLAFIGAIAVMFFGVGGLQALTESSFGIRIIPRVNNIFAFFKNYAKAVKDNHCPKINWTK